MKAELKHNGSTWLVFTEGDTEARMHREHKPAIPFAGVVILDRRLRGTTRAKTMPHPDTGRPIDLSEYDDWPTNDSRVVAAGMLWWAQDRGIEPELSEPRIVPMEEARQLVERFPIDYDPYQTTD